MTVGSKNSQRLAVLEEDFLKRLTTQLERVSAGANTLFFFTAEFNPHSLPARQLPVESAELSALALQILSLRQLLRLPTTDTPSELLRAYMKRNADLDDHNRLGPQRLAAELLVRLRTH